MNTKLINYESITIKEAFWYIWYNYEDFITTNSNIGKLMRYNYFDGRTVDFIMFIGVFSVNEITNYKKINIKYF